jgi:5S rRNA maturation endonuclease (ribonuclease M5)
MVETDQLQTQEHQLSYYEKLSNEDKERLQRLDERFFTLHDVVNNPNTRETEAERKMHLLYEMATEELEKRENNDWTIQELSLVYEKTNTLTHNVEIVIGDPSTGPTTVVEVHHDAIATPLDENDKIPLTITEDHEIIGRTVQDNTIHLATTIESLSKIDSPKKGAVIIVLTDYEENGCRGSHAYKEILAEKVSPKHPVSLVALESTQIANSSETIIGIGHRGKFDGQVETNNLPHSADAIFFNFFTSLRNTQILAFNQGKDLLGHTVGGSTCGTIELNQNNQVDFWSKIDFRTNGLASAEATSATLDENLHNAPTINTQEVFDRAKELFRSGIVSVTVSKSSIMLTSESKFAHPSVFNPLADETVMPGLFSVVTLLENYGLSQNIHTINWGDTDKQNSNPFQATIEGSFAFTDEEIKNLTQMLTKGEFDLKKVSTQNSTGLSINKEKEVLTGTVVPRYDETTMATLEAMGAEPTTMNFMTDIGAPYNLLSDRNYELYPYVFGVGDPVNLHKEEHLPARDRLWFLDALPTFINTVQQKLLEKGS